MPKENESFGEFLIRCNEEPICTVRGHSVYSVTLGDKTSYVVLRLSDKECIVQGHKDGVERFADTLDEALEQIIWCFKRHLLEIGWKSREEVVADMR